MPGGRPSKYKEEYCEMLIDHMKSGYSYTTFASVLDVNPDTLYEWEKVHPEFSETKKRAVIHAQFLFEKAGIDGMMGNIKNFNVAAWAMSMKNRFGYRDKIEHTTDQNFEIKLAYDPNA